LGVPRVQTSGDSAREKEGTAVAIASQLTAHSMEGRSAGAVAAPYLSIVGSPIYIHILMPTPTACSQTTNACKSNWYTIRQQTVQDCLWLGGTPTLQVHLPFVWLSLDWTDRGDRQVGVDP
ncbi:unnamed protein product, partial [Ectocarpus sp. 12 AP-2014]